METVYKDGRYSLCKKDGVPYLIADGKEYKLTCHPYEPCLYITDENGSVTAVHNSFDPVCTLDLFADGKTVTSITGLKYTAKDFCRMVEYAAGMYDVQIDDAEKVFGERKNNKKETEVPRKNTFAFDKYPDDPAYAVIKEYPDIVIDYCIVKDDLSYNGYNSHWSALAYACRKLFFDEEDEWHYNVGKADAKNVDVGALFAQINKNDFNYRYAFLHPPCETHYTNADFDRVNNALFPNGKEPLEVYEWTTDWSEYFDDGHEWWGTLCYTVYDKSLDRYVIILASATD